MKRWGEERSSDAVGKPTETYISEVAVAGVADAQERAYLNALPTSLALSDTQVDRLIDVGRRDLRRSPELQRLLRDLSHP
jgi:NTE family protein